MSNVLGRTPQRGLSLLEVIISLGIISAASVGLFRVADMFSEDTKVTIAASQVRVFGDAAREYIKDNYAAVQAIATPTSPAMIDVATLIAAGNLTTGTLSKNGFGQNMCVLVLEPVADRLQAIVVSEGGQTVDDLSLGSMAAVIGGSGGATYSSDAATIKGAVGGWAIPTATFDNLVNNVNLRCDGSAGNVRVAAGRPVMALWFENGNTSGAFLARDPVPGRPELNQMNTPVVMNSVQTLNGACTAVGAIARDAGGAVVSCQGGQWKSQGSSYWQDPVATFATLPACAVASAGQTRVVTTPTVGTGPRAYTCNGAAWAALAVDNSGNITIAGTATTGKVLLSDVVAQGTGCSTNGLMSRDASGQTLACQSGVWTRHVNTTGDTMSGRLNVHADDWGAIFRTSGGGDNATPQGAVGSAYVNDVYVRSIGKWVSQLNNPGGGYGSITSNGFYRDPSGNNTYFVCVAGFGNQIAPWLAYCPAGSGSVISGYCTNGC